VPRKDLISQQLSVTAARVAKADVILASEGEDALDDW
jgi:hypothetical protein